MSFFILASIIQLYIYFVDLKKEIMSEWYKIYTFFINISFLKNELGNVKIIFYKGFKIQKFA